MLIRLDVLDASMVFISMAELYSHSNCISLITNVYSHFCLSFVNLMQVERLFQCYRGVIIWPYWLKMERKS